MASSIPYILFLATLISSTYSQTSVTLPIRKDKTTSQFYTTISMGSNRATINTVIDLGSQSVWFSCDNYTSRTYTPIDCDSTRCVQVRGSGCESCNSPPGPRPGCTNNTCGSFAFNPFQDVLVGEGYGEDTLFLRDNVRISRLVFSCMGGDYIGGLAKGSTGLLGLARNDNAFQKQVVAKLKMPDIFSICFPSSGVGKLTIGKSLSKILNGTSTALVINLVSTAPSHRVGDASEEYFINVTSIRVAGEPLSLKDSYFAIDRMGFGGTKISTVQNYTSVHNSIYKPLARAFAKAAADLQIKSVAAVAPFRACFSSNSISKSAAGPSVPNVDLVLPGKDVFWRISGANAVVEIDGKTTCLAIVDAGSRPRTSIVIGAHQLEENLLEFDLVSSQLKFSSLSVQNKTCSRVQV